MKISKIALLLLVVVSFGAQASPASEAALTKLKGLKSLKKAAGSVFTTEAVKNIVTQMASDATNQVSWAGYAKTTDIPTDYAKKADIPTDYVKQSDIDAAVNPIKKTVEDHDEFNDLVNDRFEELSNN